MDIYEKFDKATSAFSAYSLIWRGTPVGRIVIKFGSAATAYVQLWGMPMVSARATGYGYDKATQAIVSAILTLQAESCDLPLSWGIFSDLKNAARSWDGGTRYPALIEQAGFTLAKVI